VHSCRISAPGETARKCACNSFRHHIHARMIISPPFKQMSTVGHSRQRPYETQKSLAKMFGIIVLALTLCSCYLT
jgi:hypothetical protein